MKLTLTIPARADLIAIGEYIGRDNPERAEGFVDELLARTARIAEQPEAYRLRPEWGDAVRSARHGQYQIVFEADANHVLILRFLHGKRDIGAVLRNSDS